MGQAFARMEEVDAELTLYDRGSELWRLNELGRGRWVGVSHDLSQVLGRAREISEATGGAFDVTVLPLMLRLGAYPRLVVPVPAEGRLLVSFYGLFVRVEWQEAKLAGAGMGVDLGGIGKGYGVDAAYEVLQGWGSGCGLVEIGGTVRVWGSRHGRWRIGVRDPMAPVTLAGAVVVARGAVASSGNYFRDRVDGPPYHIIDPRTLQPVERLGGVTVLAPDATTADALSTALFVLGPGASASLLASRFPEVTAIFFDKVASQGGVTVIGPDADAWRPFPGERVPEGGPG